MLTKKGVTCSLLRTSCGSHMISYHICSKRGATTSVKSVSLKLETQTPTLFLPFSHLPVESIIHLSAVIQQLHSSWFSLLFSLSTIHTKVSPKAWKLDSHVLVCLSLDLSWFTRSLAISRLWILDSHSDSLSLVLSRLTFNKKKNEKIPPHKTHHQNNSQCITII